jgi:hypothetical protein
MFLGQRFLVERATQFRSVSVLVLTAVIFSGCIKFPEGHFEGNLIRSVRSKVSRTSVGIDITRKRNTGHVEVKDSYQQTVLELDASDFSKESFTLSIPALQRQPFYLKKDGACYFESLTFLVDLCFDKEAFSLKITDAEGSPILMLSGNEFAVEAPFEYETPVKMTLKQAVAQALNKNFASRMEFEKLMQAKMTAQSAYLSLLPHANINTFSPWNVINPMGLLSSFGDLAPFILPSRWFQAGTSGSLAKAEQAAWTLMRADLATSVEGLAYLYERDREISKAYQSIVHRLYDLGLRVPRSAAQALDQNTAEVRLDSSNFRTVIKTDRYALAQSLGFHNPDAIQDLILGHEETSVENALLLDSQNTADIALRRSFELRQIDSLIRAARFEKTGMWFAWMDPGTAPNLSIGAALIPQFKLEKSKIRELVIRRESVQASIVQRAFEAVATYNNALSNYKLIEKVRQNTEQVLNDVLKKYIDQHSTNDAELVSVKISSYLSNYVRSETTLANFRISRAKIDRLTLQGHYLQLLPKAEDR